MAFQSIRRIIPGAIREAGIIRQVTSVRVVDEALASLTRLWGADKSAFVRVVSFSEGTLRLEATNSVALQELKIWQMRLQNEINRTIGSKVVHQIVCV